MIAKKDLDTVGFKRTLNKVNYVHDESVGSRGLSLRPGWWNHFPECQERSLKVAGLMTAESRADRQTTRCKIDMAEKSHKIFEHLKPVCHGNV